MALVPHCPPPTIPLPAIPVSETIKKIEDILSFFFPPEIIRKILMKYKGLIHPVALLVMQPALIEYHRFHKEICKEFRIGAQTDGYVRGIHHYCPPKETDEMPYFCFKLNYSEPYAVWLTRGPYSKNYPDGYDIYRYTWNMQMQYDYYKDKEPWKQERLGIRATYNEPVITSRAATENPWNKLLYESRNHYQYQPKVSVKQIKDYLKQNGIKGYSKLNKNGLIKLMMSF